MKKIPATISVLALLALLAFLAPLCAAQSSSIRQIEPKNVGSAELRIQQGWTLALEKPVTEASLQSFGFTNTTFQTVSYSANEPFTTSRDAFGNELIEFKWTPAGVGEKKTFLVTADARVDYQNAGRQLASAGDADKFLAPTSFVVVDEGIRMTAQDVIKNAADDREKLVLLAEWVNNNVAYDEAFWATQENSSTVFRTRRGVCDEYSHLLMALLRAAGIPSRFVAGFVYSGEQWGPHAWVEALVDGEWVSVDPTFNEAKVLDATHLKFATGLDQGDIKEELSAGLSLEKQLVAEVTRANNFSDFFDLELNAPALVGPGSLEEVTARVKSKSSDWQVVPLTLNVPTEPVELAVKVMNERNRLVYLKPFEEKNVSWSLLFPSELKEDYAYNFTVQATSLGKKELATIEGRVGGATKNVEKIGFGELQTRVDGNQTFFEAVVRNEGNTALENLSAVMEFNGLQQTKPQLSLAVGEEKTIEFIFRTPPAEGRYSGFLLVKNSGASARQPFELQIVPEEKGGAGGAGTGGLEGFGKALEANAVVLGAIAFILLAAIIYVETRKPRKENN